MKRVLVVEDSKMLATLISRKIHSELKFEKDIAASFKEAVELIRQHRDEYFVAVLDLHLPDAPYGEIVDYVLSEKIPVIVFTSQFSDEIREKMWSKNVVDYVVKEGGPQVIDYLIYGIDRFYKNRFNKIMVVDDSSTSRVAMKTLLEAQKFIVIEADNGEKALELLFQNPDTKIVITDYNMPGMDGFELVTHIRERFPKDKVAIIGMSAYGTSLLSAKFLKRGASDFLTKPYLEEELYCRINQNLEMLEQMDTIEKTANIDFLTGIYNRRYFFVAGQKLFENARRGNIHLTAAMIDIDRLKSINDTHGYEAGDLVVKEIALLLNRNFRAADIVSRFGGEEFAILASNMDKECTVDVFERIRDLIEKKKMKWGKKTLSVTVSIGVTTEDADSLEEMVKKTDILRSRAKENGRNCVIVE